MVCVFRGRAAAGAGVVQRGVNTEYRTLPLQAAWHCIGYGQSGTRSSARVTRPARHGCRIRRPRQHQLPPPPPPSPATASSPPPPPAAASAPLPMRPCRLFNSSMAAARRCFFKASICIRVLRACVGCACCAVEGLRCSRMHTARHMWQHASTPPLTCASTAATGSSCFGRWTIRSRRPWGSRGLGVGGLFYICARQLVACCCR